MRKILSNLFSSSSAEDSAVNDAESETTAPIKSSQQWEWGRADQYPYDHYTDAIDDVKQLKREKRHEEVEELLLWCIDFAEAEAQEPGTVFTTPPPAWYRHLAIVYRKDDRNDDEVELLERYLEAAGGLGDDADDDLVDRLEKARELAS